MEVYLYLIRSRFYLLLKTYYKVFSRAHSQVADRGYLLHGGGGQVITLKLCHVPCMFKMTFVDATKMRHIVVPTQLSLLFRWLSEVVALVVIFLCHFWMYLIYCLNFPIPEYPLTKLVIPGLKITGRKDAKSVCFFHICIWKMSCERQKMGVHISASVQKLYLSTFVLFRNVCFLFLILE